jgi:uncharacterized protein (DUF1501 family)
MWVLGGGIKGKQIHGDWQGLESDVLVEGRDVPVTTDFRDLLAPILSQHWGLGDGALATVLPDYQGLRSIDLFDV